MIGEAKQMKRSQADVLRLAVHNLANAPQAQRRYIQLGMMPKAIGALDKLGADPRAIEGGDTFSDDGVALIVELREEVLRLDEEHEDLMQLRRSEPREFLFGDALEDDAWIQIRKMARRCHLELSGQSAAFSAVMAK
jgi:hypothetical protein